MDRITCHLLPYSVLSGPENMAVDEVLLQRAAAGVTSLRFYGWSEPTLSLGYFQSASVRESDPLLAELPYVRRASGGAALVHHHELTYALALSPDVMARQRTGWIGRIHHLIADVLRELGVEQPLTVYKGEPQNRHDVLCFGKITPGDLMCGDAKIAGSSQRKYRRALLQHGGILLERSPYSPVLPGLAELTGQRHVVGEIEKRLANVIATKHSWSVESDLLGDEENKVRKSLQYDKYSNLIWNNKRL